MIYCNSLQINDFPIFSQLSNQQSTERHAISYIKTALSILSWIPARPVGYVVCFYIKTNCRHKINCADCTYLSIIDAASFLIAHINVVSTFDSYIIRCVSYFYYAYNNVLIPGWKQEIWLWLFYRSQWRRKKKPNFNKLHCHKADQQH